MRPLPIARLRKFMRLWSEHIKDVTAKIAEAEENEDSNFSDADLSDDQYSVFIKMCALGLETQLKGDRTDKQFLTYLEEVLDQQTIYRILDKTGGLNLNGTDDPNRQPLPGAGTN